MSKIHKALEKAQREREGGDADLGFPPLPEMEEEPKDLMEGLGTEPALPPKEIPRSEAARIIPRTLSRIGGTGIAANQRLVAFYEPGSLAAEQFRKLRTQLLRLKLPQPPRTILVTSAMAGEGKTLVAANLAAGIAYDLNAYALLVDCDLRRPSLGQWFSLNKGYGLSDYLIGNKEIPELMLTTELKKLKVLLGGTIQENPTELIGSEKMEALIQELKSRYSDRYIILDSTPLLSTSEPEVLSKFVDGILVVVRAGVTPRETLKQALSSINKDKILGFVLNDLQLKSTGLISRYFGSDDKYYGYYRYGKSRKSRKDH